MKLNLKIKFLVVNILFLNLIFGCNKNNSPKQEFKNFSTNNLSMVNKLPIRKESKDIKKDSKMRGAQEITVIVSKVKRENFSKYIDLSGILVARNEVKVYSDVSGKVAEILKIEGSYVNKDDVIAYIDRSQIGVNYALSPVKAPISGYIFSIYVTLGQRVAPGTVPIVSMGNILQLDININVPEIYIDEVKIGQKVLLKVPAYPNKIYTAYIYRKELSVDPLSHTLLVRAKIDNSSKELLPGMYADISILVNSVNNVIVLPNSALLKDKNNKDAVYVNQDRKALLRNVNVLFTYKDQVAIESGLNQGEEVVIFGKEFLKEGMPINPISQEEGGF